MKASSGATSCPGFARPCPRARSQPKERCDVSPDVRNDAGRRGRARQVGRADHRPAARPGAGGRGLGPAFRRAARRLAPGRSGRFALPCRARVAQPAGLPPGGGPVRAAADQVPQLGLHARRVLLAGLRALPAGRRGRPEARAPGAAGRSPSAIRRPPPRATPRRSRRGSTASSPAMGDQQATADIQKTAEDAAMGGDMPDWTSRITTCRTATCPTAATTTATT